MTIQKEIDTIGSYVRIATFNGQDWKRCENSVKEYSSKPASDYEIYTFEPFYIFKLASIWFIQRRSDNLTKITVGCVNNQNRF
jgi:hypothetical protein